MPLSKVCPACNYVNELTSNICGGCGIDIAGVSPIDTNGNRNNVADTQFKICQKCGTKNEPIEIICKNCLELLPESSPKGVSEESRGVELDSEADIEVGKPEKVEDDETGKDYIIVKCPKNGKEIVLHNGDILGRHCKGKEILSSYKTVSRRHAIFIKQEDKWFIRDLETPNYTFLNGKRISPDKAHLLKDGDMISLAGDIDFIVQI